MSSKARFANRFSSVSLTVSTRKSGRSSSIPSLASSQCRNKFSSFNYTKTLLINIIFCSGSSFRWPPWLVVTPASSVLLLVKELGQHSDRWIQLRSVNYIGVCVIVKEKRSGCTWPIVSRAAGSSRLAFWTRSEMRIMPLTDWTNTSVGFERNCTEGRRLATSARWIVVATSSRRRKPSHYEFQSSSYQPLSSVGHLTTLWWLPSSSLSRTTRYL